MFMLEFQREHKNLGTSTTQVVCCNHYSVYDRPAVGTCTVTTYPNHTDQDGVERHLCSDETESPNMFSHVVVTCLLTDFQDVLRAPS